MSRPPLLLLRRGSDCGNFQSVTIIRQQCLARNFQVGPLDQFRDFEVHSVRRSKVTAPEDIEGIRGFDEFANAAARAKGCRCVATLIIDKVDVECRSEGMVAESADVGAVFQPVSVRSWLTSANVSGHETTLIGPDQVEKILRFPFRE